MGWKGSTGFLGSWSNGAGAWERLAKYQVWMVREKQGWPFRVGW